VPQSVKETFWTECREWAGGRHLFAADWVASVSSDAIFSRGRSRESWRPREIDASDIDSALEHVDRDAELATARELVERKHAR
jgi:SOS response regulatory protein OraA/RecX